MNAKKDFPAYGYSIYWANPAGELAHAGKDLTHWKSLVSLVPELVLKLDDAEIRLTIDWGDILGFIERHEGAQAELEVLSPLVGSDKFLEFMTKYLTTDVARELRERTEVKILVEGPIIRHADAINHFLHMVFLAMNISSPGSCTLVNSSWSIKESIVGIRDVTEKELHLVGGYFDGARVFRNDHAWPIVSEIPFPDVWEWLSRTIKVGGKATSNLEKSLYSLVYACNDSEMINPGKTVWLAHALEALYDVPNQAIQKTLIDRIFLVLGKPKNNLKKIKKKLKAFYDFRSRFVHGDLRILAPSGFTESVEEEDDYFAEIFETSRIGFTLVLATLQYMVQENRNNLNFKEILED